MTNFIVFGILYNTISETVMDTSPQIITTLTPPTPKNIWDHWAMPGYEPRESQKIALDWMAELPTKKRFILCQIPVGGGKSPIAISYASFLGRGFLGSSYILTPQRILQRQYEESFGDQNLQSVYGKANYLCHTKPGLDCDIGNDIKPACEDCPSKMAFEAIKRTPHVVLNYKLALLYSELFPGEDTVFPIKDLMVFDECHTLENKLVDHRAVEITRKRCDQMKLRFFKPRDLKEAHEWILDEYLEAITELFLELEKSVKAIDIKYEFSHGGLLPSELNAKRNFKKIARHRDLVKNLVKKDLETVEQRYVLMTDDTRFQFKEIYGANLFRHILEPKANRFLFMSSTILNFHEFATDMGLPEDEVAVISLPSEFAEDSRPVYFHPTSKMAYGWNKPEKQALRTKMSNKVIDLLNNKHGPDSGIIHTGSFQIAKWLISQLKGNIDHEIISHSGDDNASRDDSFKEFTDNKGARPMVLVSPSATEGLDLVEDTARFAIFVKVPYPNLSDEWITRRKDLSSEWYQRQAMIAIIQGGGRIVRSKEDWGVTYILDESFNYLWSQFKRLTPDWWKEAFFLPHK